MLGAFVCMATLTASFTGYLLPWDQLALWAVKVPTSSSGFRFLFGDDRVRFVLLGGSEVAVATLKRWFILHTIVLPPALVVLGVLLARVTRRARLVTD